MEDKKESKKYRKIGRYMIARKLMKRLYIKYKLMAIDIEEEITEEKIKYRTFMFEDDKPDLEIAVLGKEELMRCNSKVLNKVFIYKKNNTVSKMMGNESLMDIRRESKFRYSIDYIEKKIENVVYKEWLKLFIQDLYKGEVIVLPKNKVVISTVLFDNNNYDKYTKTKKPVIIAHVRKEVEDKTDILLKYSIKPSASYLLRLKKEIAKGDNTYFEYGNSK